MQRCQDVMRMSVASCRGRDSVARAGRIMRDRNVGFLPVLGEADEVVGIVTDRDLVLRALAEARALETPVAEVMTRDVVSCSPRDDLRKAEELMVANRKSRIPVLDDARHCVGVVSLTDVAQAEPPRRAGEILEGVTRREAARLRS